MSKINLKTGKKALSVKSILFICLCSIGTLAIFCGVFLFINFQITKKNFEVSMGKLDILTWSKVFTADYYLITINDDEFTTTDNQLDLFEYLLTDGNYHINVYAKDLIGKNNSLHVGTLDYYNVVKNLYYTHTDDETWTATIDKGDARIGKVVIPESYCDLPVTAFKFTQPINLPTLTQIVNDVTVTGLIVGSNVTNMTAPEVLVPNKPYPQPVPIGYLISNLQKIVWNAPCTSYFFKNFPNLEQVIFNNDDCVIDYFGSYCPKLKKVVIPKTHNLYFQKDNCIIRYEDNTIICGGFCDDLCLPLDDNGQPYSLNQIGTDFLAFDGGNFKTLTVPTGYTELDLFSNCYNLYKVTLPDTLTTINPLCFRNCTSLEEVDFSNGLQSIEDSAFKSCTSLKKVNLPDSLQSIGIDAFYNCTTLVEVNLPNSLQKIEQNAFGRCNSLDTLNIPSSVSSLAFPFEYCDTTKIVIDQNNPYYMVKNNYVIRKSDNTIVFTYGATNNTVIITENEEAVAVKGVHLYDGAKIFLSNSLTKLSTYAITQVNRSIGASITIPHSITTIDDYAFYTTFFNQKQPINELGVLISPYPTVYIPYTNDNLPEGFATGTGNTIVPDHQGIRIWNFCALLVPNCTLKYDGDYPYVHAIEKDLSFAYNYIHSLVPPTRYNYEFLGFSYTEGSSTAEITFDEFLDLIVNTDLTTPLYTVWEKSA